MSGMPLQDQHCQYQDRERNDHRAAQVRQQAGQLMTIGRAEHNLQKDQRRSGKRKEAQCRGGRVLHQFRAFIPTGRCDYRDGNEDRERHRCEAGMEECSSQPSNPAFQCEQTQRGPNQGGYLLIE